MTIHYLEIVASDVDSVCRAYASSLNLTFSGPDPSLGNARTADLPDGSIVGVRAPMSPAEEPVVRPYWLVDNIEHAVEAAEAAGAMIAHPPMEIPGKGKFAICIQGDTQHGLWEL